MPRVLARLGDAGGIVLIAILVGYLGHAALVAAPPRAALLESQERACAIRADVCRLVDALRASGAESFALDAQLRPEVLQRTAELAYPLPVNRDAPIRVEPCRHAGGKKILFRIRDAKRAEETDADLCIVDRR